MGELNWAKINARLPYKRTKEQYQLRKKMWSAIDVNDNGHVSLSEITRVSTKTRWYRIIVIMVSMSRVCEMFWAWGTCLTADQLSTELSTTAGVCHR